MSAVPIAVRADGLRVLVVGGGSVGARKARAFLDAGAGVRVVAPEIDPALRAASGDPRLTLVAREYRPADVDDADLVVAAANTAAVNDAVARDARARRRLVCVAGEASADAGTFSMMATHRAGDLVVGVSAGGVPGAAARVRDAIAERFDGRYAAAIATLARRRGERLGAGEREAWRREAAEAVGRDFCDRVERGAVAGDGDGPWR